MSTGMAIYDTRSAADGLANISTTAERRTLCGGAHGLLTVIPNDQRWREPQDDFCGLCGTGNFACIPAGVDRAPAGFSFRDKTHLRQSFCVHPDFAFIDQQKSPNFRSLHEQCSECPARSLSHVEFRRVETGACCDHRAHPSTGI